MTTQDRKRELSRARNQKWRAGLSPEQKEAIRLRNLEYARTYRAKNPEKQRIANQKWLAKNPDWHREHHNPAAARARALRRTYGLTAEQWEQRFEQQGRVCAACAADQSGSRRGWHTDHDHATGQLRGILCHRCNVTLARLGDNADGVRLWAERLLRYLQVTPLARF